MILELHAIQSFAPANLNRDDAGTPKECTFGGVRRARVSSQAWKRAVRMAFRDRLDDAQLGTRTKRTHEKIVQRLLTADPGLDVELARHRAAVVLEAKPLELKLKLKSEDGTGEVKTGQLVFFRPGDLDALADVAQRFATEIDDTTSTVRDGAKAKSKLPKDAEKLVKTAMTSPGNAIDVALFGRMVAELPESNVDAACQVAHAIGTHRLARESDYFTAVDDLKPDETEGADMIGTVEFNASCLYRYAALDLQQLAENLGEAVESDVVTAAARAFADAFVTVAPSGKQNTFAAHNPPSAVLAVRRRSGTWNLANAFVRPVDTRDGSLGLDVVSAERMLEEFVTLRRVYGRKDDGTSGLLLATTDHLGGPGGIDGVRRVDNIDDLLDGLGDDS